METIIVARTKASLKIWHRQNHTSPQSVEIIVQIQIINNNQKEKNISSLSLLWFSLLWWPLFVVVLVVVVLVLVIIVVVLFVMVILVVVGFFVVVFILVLIQNFRNTVFKQKSPILTIAFLLV